MKSSYIIPGLIALVAANTEPTDIPSPPAYPPAALSSLPEASDNMHASSSSKCTLTTTLTLTLTKTIPVVPVTPSHSSSETGTPEPSSYSLVSPPPPQPPQPSSSVSNVPFSAKTEESSAPTNIPAATTAIPVDETSAASTELAERSSSAAPATPTRKSSVVNSDGSNTHASHIPVQSASSKPVGGSATTLMKTTSFSRTGTVTGAGTGTGSYVPSSTPPFADAANVVRVPGAVMGVMGWAVLML